MGTSRFIALGAKCHRVEEKTPAFWDAQSEGVD
jgi:hypothetical protein